MLCENRIGGLEAGRLKRREGVNLGGREYGITGQGERDEEGKGVRMPRIL